MLNNKIILITGGTGSLGHALVELICSEYKPKKLIIFSRDEYKQSLMAKKYNDESIYGCLRFFLGDVRNLERVKQALAGVDIVIHAAALKQIPALEYNPSEAVLTNIDGTRNVTEACVYNCVQRAVLTSTDKAVNPINLYGATKLCAEKLFLAYNSYNRTKFSVVRYGNVINSRGSIIEHYLNLKSQGNKCFPLTDENMTRFWITLEEAAQLVLQVLESELTDYPCVPCIPSMRTVDVARTIDPDCSFRIIGIRPGEKIHESLISEGEKVNFFWGERDNRVTDVLTSENNELWMSKKQLLEKL